MNTENKLPVYSQLNHSIEFQLAFSHTGTFSSVTCICGRTHFCEQFPIDDEQDAVEKEKLDGLNERFPEQYISHPDCVSYFTSIGKSIVFDCLCNYAGFFEELINDHANSILNYLDSVSSTKKDSSDAFNAKVQKVKALV